MTTPPNTSKQRKKPFGDINLRLAQELRKRPGIVAATVLTSITATTATGVAWYVLTFAQAPWSIERLDEHLTLMERNHEIQMQRLEIKIEAEEARDEDDRAIVNEMVGRLNAIERWLETIANKL